MLIDKHNRGSKNHQRSIVTFLSLVLGVHFMPGLSEAGETQTEHCYTASSAEVCLRPHLIERLVDTDALRHALEKLRAPQRDLFLSTRTIAKQQNVTKIADRWHQVVGEALARPGDRLAFYEWLYGGGMNALLNVRLDVEPMLRVTGLPETPRASFNALAMAKYFKILQFPGFEEKPVEETAKLLDAKFSSMATSQPMFELAKSFNLVGLSAEFSYQLRRFYVSVKKEVIIFEDEAGGSSPAVDLLGTLYLPKSYVGLDVVDLEVAMLHEATHLALPNPALLYRMLSSRAASLGPFGQMISSPQSQEIIKTSDVDVELEVDAHVMSFLRHRSVPRTRYITMVERFEPQSARGELLRLLNTEIESGSWPRPAIRLSLAEILPALKAMKRSEDKTLPTEDRLASLLDTFQQMLVILPKSEQAFYSRVYSLAIKHAEQRKKILSPFKLRYSHSETKALEEAVSILFSGVVNRWQNSQ